MKLVFVSVGTSLLEDGLLGGPKDVIGLLRRREAVAAWAASASEEAEYSEKEARDRLTKVVTELEAGSWHDSARALGALLGKLPGRIELLRDAFVTGGPDDADLALLPAELASLASLLPVYRLRAEDRVVLLSSDSPQGGLVGRVLEAVLQDHPLLGGAAVEAVWPAGWQPHDVETLRTRGMANLLDAVDRRLAERTDSRPFFVLTAGLKLASAVLTQVACWPRTTTHDGLLFKLEDPGFLHFPPCRFVRRGREEVLIPQLPTTPSLHAATPFTERLCRTIEGAGYSRARLHPSEMRTTLVVTVGTGLLLASPLLKALFSDKSRPAESSRWKFVLGYGPGAWAELREKHDKGPTAAELKKVADEVATQLQEAWTDGDSSALPAELASLRWLFSSGPRPEPLLRGPLQILLLATDTPAGELCASWVETFLAGQFGRERVGAIRVPGLHPHRSVTRGEDRFSNLAEIVVAAAAEADRLLFLPLGGPKVPMPILTVLASRLRAPLLLGHADLDGPIVVPWLEKREGRIGVAQNLSELWPELRGLPVLRLETD